MAHPNFRSAGTVDAGSAGVTPGLPSGHTTNDILLLVVQSSNEAISAPSGGWAEVLNSPQGTGTAATAGSVRLGVFWKRHSGSESAPTVSDTGNHTIARIFAFSGCITTGDPWDVTAGAAVSSASATVTFPSLVTTVAETHIVAIACHAIDSSSATTSSWTQGNISGSGTWDDNSVSTGTGGGFGVLHGLNIGPNWNKATAGDIGSIGCTLSSSSKQGNLIIALRPPVADTTVGGFSNYYTRLMASSGSGFNV